MYTVLLSLIAKRQLQKLEKNLQKRIIAVLERIRLHPEKYVKRIVGDRGYRLRVGDYRIIMDIDKEKLLILVIKISHRRSVYKG
ncbi:MAG: type II toxin-antitoxin system RelE/ParE family toxin [Nanoarchaeota archaeon]